ncbi:MAG: low-specificity L-threonine aldolase [Chloroflexi bacterium]|nr:low-specificity L-threonine aldolase [Chloroflexota bacterium]MCL5076151.1 low-specificity L-threonine aldolase [Chloroflexota bacterium]
MIDLRSDTVTLPTAAMREAMYRAELGDDVFGEDPTVNRLEEMAAAMMGKERALLVTSGTMGNLVGVLSHCQRGDEIIVGDQSHVLHYEVGGCAALGGLLLRALPNVNGGLDAAMVEAAIRGLDIHAPRTALLCLENTHNRCGGAVLTVGQTRELCGVAKRHGLMVHLDGARIFNAAVYLGVPTENLVAEVDSVTFCLSKGLAAPVGSLLCGTEEYIQRARKYRKMVGGGMRQAGIIAAAGIVALEQMIDRLAEDHQNARLLAEGLAEIEGISLDPTTVQTNIIAFHITERITVADLLTRLAAEGVRGVPFGPQRVRFVTHYGITVKHVQQAIMAVRRVLKA